MNYSMDHAEDWKQRPLFEVIVILTGLYLLFSIFNVITDPPYIVPLIGLVFIPFCIWVVPAVDSRICSGKWRQVHEKSPEPKSPEKFYRTRGWDVLVYLSITIITFTILHFLVIYMHELSHSFMACFLGAKENPLDIIWGRGIFAVACDENVDYQSLFSAGKGTTAAIIAFAGPLSNIILFAVTAIIISLRSVKERPWVYHTVFWTLVVTFIMVFEYVFTRSFITGDDFGNIEHGLGLSPYSIFIPGMILGLTALWYIFTVLVPGHFRIVTPFDLPKQYITIASVSFVFFLLYIGLRINAYPSFPEWWCGLVGIFALFVTPVLVSPMRRWVEKKTGK
jgi:magnesium-transporting ATPase (P-type)